MQYMKKNNLLFPLHSIGGAVFLKKIQKKYIFICTYQKKAVPLQRKLHFRMYKIRE